MYTASSSVGGTTPAAANTAIAIARSNAEPCFGMDAGVRFTVIFRAGNGLPAFAEADRTRSRASPREVSGSPMMLNPGSWFDNDASTSMWRALTPMSAIAPVLPTGFTPRPARARRSRRRRTRAAR
jgi:hypothetical protein